MPSSQLILCHPLYNEAKGCTAQAHNSDFKVDDDVLHLGAETFVQFVLDNMNGIQNN